jgi:inner membrane protein
VDNLTHTLTGVMLSRAGLNRLAPRATLMLALAANAPDLDVISWLGGSLTYLRYHRWWTHAWVLAPLLALLPALLVWLLEKRRPVLVRLWLVSLVGVASHLLLDWTNVYGIRMLLPFSSAWLRLDTVNVVDIWIWAILLLGIAAPFLSRLVSSEIGAKSSPGRGWAWFVLLLFGGYEFGRFLAHQRAVAVLESRVYAGTPPRRIAAFPGPANPFLWKGLVETDSSFVLFDVNLLSDFDPTRGRSFFKGEPGPALAAAKATEPFRGFQDF